MATEVKRLKVDTPTEQQSALSLVEYGSDGSEDESEQKSEGESEEQADEANGLPAGFFDAGVEPELDEAEEDPDVQMDDEKPNDQPALPAGFFDSATEQKAAETKTSVGQIRVEQKKDLAKDLASFEAEIADLAEENSLVRTTDEADMQKSAIDELDRKDREWKARTQRLAKMRAVIQEGLKEMDASQMETNEEQADAASSGSDSDMSDIDEIVDWRSRTF
ncbi:hypothetical protein EC988_004857 [Linderina pennispora]|nr:hypothetical protein EC988_004857 [Linderina pennispora]